MGQPALTEDPSFPRGWLAAALALTMLALGGQVWLVGYTEQRTRDALERQIQLERLRGDLLFLDEVLTMSAQMAAASGSPRWADRYTQHEIRLAAALQETQTMDIIAGQIGISTISPANSALVGLEQQALQAARSGDLLTAQEILNSPTYQLNKQRYAHGQQQMLERLDGLHQEVVRTQRLQVRLSQIAGVVGGILLLGIWFGVIHSIRRWQGALMATRSTLAETRSDLVRLNTQLEAQIVERTRLAEVRSRQVRAMARELTRVEQRERRRIAQLLHDHLQQLLVAARLHLGLLPESPPRQRVDGLLQEALQASRSLTVELNPPILLTGSLPDALVWLGDWMDRTHALEVTVRCAPALPALDREVLLVAFDCTRELLFNVVKHAQTDSAALRCLPDADGRGVILTIEDQGVGFDPDALRGIGQTGLFSSARRLELVGGKMHIHTQPHSGCSITLHLPPIEEDEDDSLALAPPPPDSLRVLLVDDHPVVRAGLTEFLRTAAGVFVVGEASSLEEAEEIARQTALDVAVVDVSLRDAPTGGIEVARLLASLQPEIRIIALSSHSTAEIQAQMTAVGAERYLIKGCPPEDILAALRSPPLGGP